MNYNVSKTGIAESECSAATVDYRFKILYAVGMIAVVAGHCSNGGISLFYDWFAPYSFHLSLFAFSSGYFYKSKNEQNPGKYILKKVKTLLVPLYLWNLFYGILGIVLGKIGFTFLSHIQVNTYTLLISPIKSGHDFILNMGGWFVIPLFMIEVFNVLFRKLTGFLRGTAREIVCYCIYLVIGILGVCLAIKGYNYGWWLVLVRMLVILPFYAMGILYKNVLEQYDTCPNGWYFALIVIAQLVVVQLCGGWGPAYIFAWCQDFVHGPLMPFVAGYLGIFFWLRMARILEPVIGQSKPVNLIADNTFSIMVNQFLGFLFVSGIYAVLSKLVELTPLFDMNAFYGNLWYTYLPGGFPQFRIFYLIAGLAVPIIMQLVLNKIWDKMRGWIRRDAQPQEVFATAQPVPEIQECDIPEPAATKLISLGLNCEVSFQIEKYLGSLDSGIFSWVGTMNDEHFLQALENVDDILEHGIHFHMPSDDLFYDEKYDLTFHGRTPKAEMIDACGNIIDQEKYDASVAELKSRVNHLKEKHKRDLNSHDRKVFLRKQEMADWEGKVDYDRTTAFVRRLDSILAASVQGGTYQLVIVVEKHYLTDTLRDLESDTVSVRTVDYFAPYYDTKDGADHESWQRILEEFC